MQIIRKHSSNKQDTIFASTLLCFLTFDSNERKTITIKTFQPKISNHIEMYFTKQNNSDLIVLFV